MAHSISLDVALLLITSAELQMSSVKDGGRVSGAGDRLGLGEAAGPLFYWICGKNLWICIVVQIIPTLPKEHVQWESMLIRAACPKIRAQYWEDISCSLLMVIGESVLSDCCLKGPSVLSSHFLQCLFVYLKQRNISPFFPIREPYC